MTLRDGQVYVMGDNRTVSVDSRVFGPVSVPQVRGRVFYPKK